MSRLYTKTGDKGETSLRTGERVRKSDSRVEAYGMIDELNSAIGIVVAQLAEPSNLGPPRQPASPKLQRGEPARQARWATTDLLAKVQSDLFHVGALLSGEKKEKEKRLNLLKRRVSKLESHLDKLQEKLPQQTAFYFPGGSKQAASLDFARAVCRRAERRVVAVSGVEPAVVKYLNRLSDYLYALARWANYSAGVEEKEWKSEL